MGLALVRPSIGVVAGLRRMDNWWRGRFPRDDRTGSAGLAVDAFAEAHGHECLGAWMIGLGAHGIFVLGA